MNKNRLLEILFSLVILLTGNLFWIIFGYNLKTEHLITNSPLTICLSLLAPIMLYGIYLAFLLQISFLTRRKFWIALILLSNTVYPFIIDINILESLTGILIVSGAVFYFLYNFQRLSVLYHGKKSFLGRLSLSLSGTTLIITLVMASHFYSFYRMALFSGRTIIPDRTVIENFNPVIKIYLRDLNITDLNETFGNYLRKQSYSLRMPVATVRSEVLLKLGLGGEAENQTMGTVIKDSINGLILKLTAPYRRQLPVLISLGLGIIIQTMLTASIYVCYLVSLLFITLGGKKISKNY